MKSFVRKDPSIMHPLAGGVFPFPPAVSELVKRLAPPSTFEVVFIINYVSI
jgi:hypothetical protein